MAAGTLQPFEIKDPKSWGPAYGSWFNQQPATAQVLATTMLGALQVSFRDSCCLVQAVSPGLVERWGEACCRVLAAQALCCCHALF